MNCHPPLPFSKNQSQKEGRSGTHDSKSLRARTYLFIALIMVLSPLGNASLREGMDRIGAPTHWTSRALAFFFGRTFHCGAVWVGISLLTLFFICYMLVLSWADFSYVQPASAGSYVVVALLGSMVLGEHVPVERWIGIGLICVGAVLVGRTSPASERDN